MAFSSSSTLSSTPSNLTRSKNPYKTLQLSKPNSSSSLVIKPKINYGRLLFNRRSQLQLLARSTDKEIIKTSSESDGKNPRGVIESVGEVLCTAFPLWVALACLLGLFRPSSFFWVRQKWQIVGLAFTMLGMGMTLTLDDLRGALAMPKEVLCGFVLQYSEITNQTTGFTNWAPTGKK